MPKRAIPRIRGFPLHIYWPGMARLRLAATAVLLGSVACGQPTSVAGTPRLIEKSRLSMGSPIHLTAWTSDDTGANSAFEAVFAEFDRLDALMTVWRSSSDIQRLNAAAGDHAVQVDPDVRDVLKIARQVS